MVSQLFLFLHKHTYLKGWDAFWSQLECFPEQLPRFIIISHFPFNHPSGHAKELVFRILLNALIKQRHSLFLFSYFVQTQCAFVSVNILLHRVRRRSATPRPCASRNSHFLIESVACSDGWATMGDREAPTHRDIDRNRCPSARPFD